MNLHLRLTPERTESTEFLIALSVNSVRHLPRRAGALPSPLREDGRHPAAEGGGKGVVPEAASPPTAARNDTPRGLTLQQSSTLNRLSPMLNRFCLVFILIGLWAGNASGSGHSCRSASSPSGVRTRVPPEPTTICAGANTPWPMKSATKRVAGRWYRV